MMSDDRISQKRFSFQHKFISLRPFSFKAVVSVVTQVQ